VSRRFPLPADLGALSGCASDIAQAFVSLDTDIALVIDELGIVTSVAQDPLTPMAPAAAQWVGKRWADTVTSDTRRKIELLLADVGSTGVGRRREVNHAGDGGTEIPVCYQALRLGAKGPVLVAGRDMRGLAAIQHRFLDVQQELERAYWQTRHGESRLQLLFHVATDAVLTVDADTSLVVDGNAAASALLQGDGGTLCARVVEQQFEARSRPALHELLAQARATGRATEIQARLAGSHTSVSVSATPFRAAGGLRLLLRMRRPEPRGGATEALYASQLQHLDGTDEALVVTDSAGRLVLANPAFARLVRAADGHALQGSPIGTWLGGPGGRVQALISQVREQGLAQPARCRLRRSDGEGLTVEISGMLLTEGDREGLGFALRPCLRPAAPGPRPLPAAGPQAAALACAIEALASDLGAAPLPDLMLQAEQLVRRHLLRSALKQSAGDAAAAAQLLGVDLPQFLAWRQECATGAADSSW
jgi:transcriptional regulator PpsR